MRSRSATFRHLPVALLAAAIAVSAVGVAAAAASTLPPAISHYTASPDQLTYKGGTLTLKADTKRATTCEFSSTYSINGLPKTEPCPGGHPSITLKIARNTGKAPKNIDFVLKATGAGGYATQTLYLHEEPRPPVITSFKSSTSKLPASGGKVTFTGDVLRATTCIISAKPKVTGLPKSFNCSSGTVTATVTLPGTTSGTEAGYGFDLTAAGLGGASASAATFVYVSARTPTVTDFTATPSTLPASGGTVLLSAKVTNAVACNYGDAWKGGDPSGTNPVSNLKSIKCSSGTVTFKATVIADTSAVGEKITFEMTVNSQSAIVDAKQTPVVHQSGS